jgi:hypothetical protein
MRFMMQHLSFITLMILLSSCNSQEAPKPPVEDEVVVIKTGGVHDQVTLSMDTQQFLGFFLVGTDPRIVTITAKNTSRFEVFDIDLELSSEVTAGMEFVPNADAEKVFPGFGGTCGRVIAPGASCTMRIVYNPILPGSFTQALNFKYTTILNIQNLSFNLDAVAGEPASLIFTNETTSYDLGIVERTFQDSLYYQVLNVENRGGLPAENLVLTVGNTPDTDGYRISEHNCPETLAIGEGCQVTVVFSTQNYGPAAPDGDTDFITYTGDVTFNYERDPFGTPASLNAQISTFSTTIEAIIEPVGLQSITFNELVVGNTQTRLMRVTNNGYKEAILRSIHVKNPDNSLLATCVDNGGEWLECRDAQLALDVAPALSLADFPFRIQDSDECLISEGQLNYTRPGGELDQAGIETIAAATPSTPGRTCSFNVTFHPSVSYMTDGNWQDISFSFEYDTTWLDQIVLKNTKDIVQEDYFTVADAPYRSAAVIINDRLSYAGAELVNSLLDPVLYRYDLGRIGLVSSSIFTNSLNFRLANLGGHEATIVSIVDGSDNTVESNPKSLNSYYNNLLHAGCSTVARSSGTCQVSMSLTPLGSTSTDPAVQYAQENGQMFDGTIDDVEYKRFIITYQDGVSFEDDLTPREPRQIEVRFSATLVRKGVLVYDQRNGPGLTRNLGTHANSATHETTLLIENVGTGAIPWIRFEPGLDLMGTTQKNEDAPYPFEVIAKSPAQVLAQFGFDVDLDCSSLVLNSSSALPTPQAGLAPGVLGAGQSCALTVQSELRDTDVLGHPTNNNTAWATPIFPDNAERNWEKRALSSSTSVRLSYYDGDGVSDADYTVDTEGYGRRFLIGLPGQDTYNFNIAFRLPASILPDRPGPATSAVLYKPGFTLPELPIHKWGDPRLTYTRNANHRYAGFGDTFNWAAPARRSLDHLSTAPVSPYLPASASDAHFLFHAGSFPAGGEYTFSFALENFRESTGTITQMNLDSVTPAGTITFTPPSLPFSLGFEEISNLIFTFTPNSPGDHRARLSYTYLTGGFNDDGTEEEHTVHIDILVHALPSDFGHPVVLAQDYFVSYDELSDPQISEALLGDLYEVTTEFMVAPEIENIISFNTIRGSQAYLKKDFYITNPHEETISNVRFMLKTLPSSLASTNGIVNTSYWLENNNCNGVDLAESQMCSFTIKFRPHANHALLTNLTGSIKYHWQDQPNQYVQSNFNLEFIAVNPAILMTTALSSASIVNSVTGGNFPGSYAINFGKMTNINSNNHPLLTVHPQDFYRPGAASVQIRNVSQTKASYIAQYRLFISNFSANPPPWQDWTTIYATANVQIQVNHYCFYGDDYDDAGIPMDEKGFNDTSVNPCMIRPIYTANGSVLSENLNPGSLLIKPENIHRLVYFDNMRSSTNFINFYTEGFIEGDRSVRAEMGYSDLYVDHTGTLEISWTPMNPVNPDWGPVVGYRLYYTNILSQIRNFFQHPTINYIDTMGLSAEIEGLVPNRLYYVQVVALRDYNGKIYVSRDSRDRYNNIYSFIVPDEEHFYDFETNSLIRKRIELNNAGSQPFMGNYPDVLNHCKTRNFQLSLNGSTVNRQMDLIRYPQFDAIVAGGASYTLGPLPLSNTPMWIGGGTVNIISIFGDSAAFNLNGNDGLMFYMKPDMETTNLNVIEGGDGEEFPLGASLYVDGLSYSAAFARCYLPRP